MDSIHEISKKHILTCDKCFGYIANIVMVELARRAGKTTSVTKAKSSRENGKLGGRPRKTK